MSERETGTVGVLGYSFLELRGNKIQRLIPACLYKFTVFPNQRMHEPIIGFHDFRQQDSLYTQTSFIDRTVRITFDRHDLTSLYTGQDAAAGPTVAADSFNPFFDIFWIYRSLLCITFWCTTGGHHRSSNGKSLQEIPTGK